MLQSFVIVKLQRNNFSKVLIENKKSIWEVFQATHRIRTQKMNDKKRQEENTLTLSTFLEKYIPKLETNVLLFVKSFFLNLHFCRFSNFLGHVFPPWVGCLLIIRNFRRNPRPLKSIKQYKNLTEEILFTILIHFLGTSFFRQFKWNYKVRVIYNF
jgi:hypothetical protein